MITETNTQDIKITDLEKLKKLHKEGEAVLNTRYSHPPGVALEDSVDDKKFTEWKTSCILLLEQMLPLEHSFLKDFRDNLQYSSYSQVNEGVSKLNALIKHIEYNNLILSTNLPINSDFNSIENILNKFHRVARQLRIRHDNRDTIEIRDEYDVQDLLHALLLINFEDVRPEERTPSYAGGSSRMDFLIKDINTVIETKMTRENLKDKKIGEELIIDITKYAKHPDCDKLYCFVYDKGEFIKNPKGLENDLSESQNGLEVKVIIIPKF